MYGGGTIFVDHVTGMIYNYHQVTFSAAKTVQAKQAYECELEQYNRKVKHYHADNGIFDAAEFKESLQIMDRVSPSVASGHIIRTVKPNVQSKRLSTRPGL
jgi:hypothetical protein